MPQEYDAIIIGGGHNGLVTAGYLAKAGLRVIVLERRPVVGGAVVTEELIPGFKFNTFSYVCALLHPKVIEELELPKFGLDIYLIDPAAFKPFPDGQHLFLWADTAKTAKEIEKFSKKDARAYIDMERYVNWMLNIIEPWILSPAPSVAQLASRFKTPEEEKAFSELMLMSIKDFLEERFESEHVKGTLAQFGAGVGSAAGPMTPGSLFTYVHAGSGHIGGRRGASGFVRGGMGAITQAMAKSAQSRGAVIRTDAEVARIMVKGGKVTGVELTNGEQLKAKAIASNADPKRTFLNLIEEQHLEESFRQQARNIKLGGCSFKALLALDGLPNFTAYPGAEPGPQHVGRQIICPSMEYLEKGWDEFKYGRPSQKPWMICTIQSVTDPSVAPPGKHTLSIFAGYAPYHLKDSTWEEERDRFGHRCIDTLTEYAPNLRDIIIDYKFLSPVDIEETLYMTEGNIFHGDLLPHSMFSFRPMAGWARYRTPIKNLYLCGSGAHPGGYVSGIPGHNAAQEIIKDWREGAIE